MRNKILIIIGTILLVSLLLFGAFALPIALPLCSLIGLIYGIYAKDKRFVIWFSIAFFIGVLSIVYTLGLISSM